MILSVVSLIKLAPSTPGEGRGLQFKTDAERGEGHWRLATYQLRTAFRNCRMALHAKAKAEPGYRFYALYDKISREDISGTRLCSTRRGVAGPIKSPGQSLVGAASDRTPSSLYALLL